MTKEQEALKLTLEALEMNPLDTPTDVYDTKYQKAIDVAKEALALPAQGQQYKYLIDDLSEWKQYVEVDCAPYGLREHVTKVLRAHGIKEMNT